MSNAIAAFQQRYMSYGSWLAEWMYGFIMVAVVYVGIIVPLSRIVTYVERKRRIPGLGTPVEVRVRRRRPAAA